MNRLVKTSTMEFISFRLAVDPADAGYHGALADLDPEQRGEIVRDRLAEILDEEDAAELATRLNIKATGLTGAEQATLLDIVKQYHSGAASPQNAAAWIYGLIANSALNDGSL